MWLTTSRQHKEASSYALWGTCQALMNGGLHPDHFRQPIMADDTGLRLKRRMSHAFVVDTPSYPRTLIITDSAINVGPKLEEKADIVQNAIDLAHVLGIATPKVAILSTIETVSSNIPSTIDARNVADLGISMPKQMDKRLVQFSASHPKLRLSMFIIPQVPGDIARSKALARCVPKDTLKRRPSSRDARDRAVCGHGDDPWALLTR
jgi:hypothetical protein